MKTEIEQTKVYELLSRAFVQERVETCFALLGDGNMKWASCLSALGTRMIYVRHEHCAVAAAMAYSRKTGNIGVATVTCGPGLTQILTALPAAVRAHIPLVIFAGEAPIKSNWYNQAIDQAPFVRAAGAVYKSLHHPELMAQEVRDAFLQAKLKKRPVILGVPLDLQNTPVNITDPLPDPSHLIAPDIKPIQPHPQEIARAAKLIKESRRIVVIAGIGAVQSNAGEACRKFSMKCDALLATSLPARGLFHDDPFSIGISGGYSSQVGRECLSDADLIIAVGCSLAQHNTDGGKLWPDAKVLQIDVDPIAISQGQLVAGEHVRADARLGVEALTVAVTERPNQWRSSALSEFIKNKPADSTPFDIEPGLHDPRNVVSALESDVPMDWELVNSSGHCSYFFAQMPSRPVERFLTIREFGAIGNGISFAIGVAAARPNRPVVLFDGDGSLLMHVQELETIKRHELKILVCVLNDGGYGSEIQKLRADGFPDEGAVFGRTDLAAISQGFGLRGERVEDLSTIPELIEEFESNGRAAVWDFPVSDRVVSPVIQRSHASGKNLKSVF